MKTVIGFILAVLFGLWVTGASARTLTLMGVVNGTYNMDSMNTDAGGNVTVSVSSININPLPSNCINLGPPYPKVYGCASNTISSCSPQVIPAGGTKEYCFTIDKTTISSLTVTMSSADWKTNSHEFVSNIANPALSEIKTILATQASGSPTVHRTGNPPWYNLALYSNERVYLIQSAKQGDKYYVTVYNPGSTSSKIILYWVAY